MVSRGTPKFYAPSCVIDPMFWEEKISIADEHTASFSYTNRFYQ